MKSWNHDSGLLAKPLLTINPSHLCVKGRLLNDGFYFTALVMKTNTRTSFVEAGMKDPI